MIFPSCKLKWSFMWEKYSFLLTEAQNVQRAQNVPWVSLDLHPRASSEQQTQDQSRPVIE